MRRISSHLALTSSGLLPDVVVTVSEAGVIVDVCRVSHLDREAGVEFFPGILVPGFVNVHCHLELSHLRGAIPAGRGFGAFVRGMKAAPRGGSEDAAGYWDAKMWKEGISAVGDICNGADTFPLKRTSPIRYHNFIEIFGIDADPERAFAMRDQALAAGLTATTTPHSLYSLSPENFTAAIGDNTFSIHFMESEYEVSAPAETLVAQTPPDRPVLLVHNCLVTQRDIDIVMEHFTAPVTWVLCPASNLNISGLRPPVELLRKNRLNIAVGTDSLASNDRLSMVRELSLLKGVPLAEILGWATLGGAKALGLDDTLGIIEVGKSPGFAVLSGVDLENMALTENARAERII